MFSRVGASRVSGGISMVLGALFGLLLVALALPAGAQTSPGSDGPSLSVSDRLEDRR